MKTKAIQRGFIGFPVGVLIGYLITIVISLTHNSGNYFSAPKALEVVMGSEIGAVLLQALLCGLLGSTFAAGSVIWEFEDWSILKQSIVHFFITSIIMLPVAYSLRWMDHSFAGFAGYFGFFLSIYAAIWVTQYLTWKSRVKQMNEKINEINRID